MGISGVGEVVLLFIFVSVFLGAVIAYGIARTLKQLPFTAILFILGVICSIINTYTPRSVLADSLELLASIPSTLTIYVFLPPLFFGYCMTLNPNLVRGSAIAILTLGIPGAFMFMYLFALLVYYTFPYNWPWNLCCIFGAALSATDPAAVITLLQQVNVSPQLTMLISGEAIINDAFALILFNLYLEAFQGDISDSLEPSNVIPFLLKNFLVSPLLGISLGMISSYCICRADRRLESGDKLIQAGITIATAYVSFFTGESICNISGILTCSFAGFTVSFLASDRFIDRTQMTDVWDTIQWLANVVLFIIGGLIVGSRILINSVAIDYAYICVSYIFLNIVRFIVVNICFPVLANFGQKISYNQAIFTVWGGLRGGVALAISLTFERLSQSNEITINKVDGSRVVLIVGGTLFLTLIINAFSALPVLEVLDLIKHDTEDLKVVHFFIMKRMKLKVIDLLRDLMTKLQNIDFIKLKTFCSILDGESDPSTVVMTQIDSPIPVVDKSRHNFFANMTDFSTQKKLFQDAKQMIKSAAAKKKKKGEEVAPDEDMNVDLLKRVRFTFLEIVRQSYWSQISDGVLSRASPAVKNLFYSVDVGQDKVDKGLTDWDALEDDLLIGKVPKAFSYWHLRSLFLTSIKYSSDVAILCSFITAHEEAQKQINMYFGDEENSPLSPEERLVITESETLVAIAKKLFSSIPVEELSLAQTVHTAAILLKYQETLLSQLREEGILLPSDVDKFDADVQRDIVKLETAESPIMTKLLPKSLLICQEE